ncbi:MAG: glycosyltransferase [Dehalococcoidia bacterium]|nr:MAG: glycosyltransferase [Dehalococcoidia bacterium]
MDEVHRAGIEQSLGEKTIQLPLEDGTVYSRRKDFCPFSTPPLEAYAPIVGEEKVERLYRVAERLKGLKLLELNATAQGGGVAEMLYSSIPFLNELGIEAEWKIICGPKEYYESTKSLHNLLQGMKGSFTPEMEQTYLCTLEECGRANLIDYNPDVVLIHDPQPLGLIRYLEKPGRAWLWRCHIDIEEETLEANPGLWDFITRLVERYDAAIVSAAHYVASRWPLPKFIIPPFIDPLSEKNREMTQEEIDKVLAKYHIDPQIPIIAQIGRFDPWKGLDRTIAAYRLVRKERKCQLVLAGGLAADDPEAEMVLAKVYHETKDDEDIHVLHLSLADRLENWVEVNALQRAAKVIMQPSTKEGFGLVITEALWKSKPVIAADVGAIPLQIRDGETGYFYQTPYKTAQKVIYLLENSQAAEIVGKRGRRYVEEHFLLPDRIADCLMAVDMTMNQVWEKKLCTDCIVSFHPWFKLSKRK